MASDKVATKTPQQTGLMTRPEYVTASNRGAEDLERSDVIIPRLCLAQNQSPETTEGDPKYIVGLKAGQLFNNVTKQVYGDSVIVQLVRRDKPRAMIFAPIDEGGGILEPDVPMDDPRTQFGKDGEKPTATTFRDYLAVIKPSQELIGLSFKSSGLNCARLMNGTILRRQAGIWAGLFTLSSAPKLVPKPHKVWVQDDAGWASAEDYALGEKLFEAYKDVVVALDHDAHDPEHDAPASAAPGDREPGSDDNDDIKF